MNGLYRTTIPVALVVVLIEILELLRAPGEYIVEIFAIVVDKTRMLVVKIVAVIRASNLFRLPAVMSAEMNRLPRMLIGGIIAIILGFVVVVVGIVLFGTTSGIGAYIDRTFEGMGVQANITKTMGALQFNTVFNIMGIVIMFAGFILLMLALLGLAREAKGLWRGE